MVFLVFAVLAVLRPPVRRKPDGLFFAKGERSVTWIFLRILFSGKEKVCFFCEVFL